MKITEFCLENRTTTLFLTVVAIVGGTIAFNSDDIPEDRELLMREMEAMARSAGLPWPIDKDATEEQVLDRMTRLLVVTFSHRIDQALKLYG